MVKYSNVLGQGLGFGFRFRFRFRFKTYLAKARPASTLDVLFDIDLDCAADEEEDVGSTGRLFLRNLPFTSTEAELSDAFLEYGDLQEVHLVLDRSVFH